MSKITHHQLHAGRTDLPFIVGKFDDVVNYLLQTAKKKSIVVLPCTLYDLAMVSSSAFYADPYSQLDFCTTDGMPLVWWFKGKTKHSIERVYGPDIINLTVQRTDLGRQLILCPNQMVFSILKKKFSQQIKKK